MLKEYSYVRFSFEMSLPASRGSARSEAFPLIPASNLARLWTTTFAEP